MPRTPRLDFPGARHHVMNRGARKQPIFHDREDHEAFLAALASLPGRFALGVEAYALMSNHYHLSVRSRRGNLSRAMQHLQSRYARHVNGRHGWDGSPFRGRFRNRLVVDESYGRHLSVYIHRNPVVAGLAATVDEARWTSHRAFVGRSPCPSWLEPGDLLALHGDVAGYRRYLEDLEGGEREAPDGFGPEEPWRASSTGFVMPADVPRVAPHRVLQALCEVLGVQPSGLRRPRRGDRSGHLAAWSLCTVGGMTHAEAGAWLGITGSAITRRLAAFERLCLRDPEIGRALVRILERLERRAA